MTSVGPAVRVERKLRSFGGLVRGWHYGEGEPIAAETVRLARRLHLFSVALGFTNMDAFPCVNGEVLLTIYADRYL